ncbi:MAG: phosphoribosylamine--glycine ligase [Candidatus Moraniibacteriota bacterium]
MNILILGGGGREHALGWKLSQSSRVEKILFSPGNGGTLNVGENVNLDLADHSSVLSWIEKQKIDLVVVGPDEYLAQGVVDSLYEKVKVFGPTKAAAEIEWSKAYAKQFMAEEGIPTAKFATFSEMDEAQRYIREEKFPLVIKADGLALGKGVVIARTLEEANQALTTIMKEKIYGSAGNKVVIEEFLTGKEISIHAFCDGETAILFPSSQDHKQAFDNDEGPNTGGMGTIAPVPGVSEAQLTEIQEKIIIPTLQGLKKRGRTFLGLLFPGVMLTSGGPKVIEFNARFGDPETQSYMRLLKTDLLEILLACVGGKLMSQKVEWEKGYACCVVLASGGYPHEYKKGISIHGLETADTNGVVVFQAGTRFQEEQLVTNGGRVLGVTTTGESLEEALDKAYTLTQHIHFEGMQFRKDIGQKALTNR